MSENPLPDLSAHYREMLDDVPSGLDDDFLFHAGRLPPPPPELTTSEVLGLSGQHEYGSFRVDRVDCMATRSAFRSLGICVLAAVFNADRANVRIHLRQARSAIKTIVIESPTTSMDDPSLGYNRRPHYLFYAPKTAERHPWPEAATRPYDLPVVRLTNESELLASTDDWDSRDVICGFGPDTGAALLAELLLNLGGPNQEEKEIALESESGFRGVGPGSAELRLFLPGSFGWREDLWDR